MVFCSLSFLSFLIISFTLSTTLLTVIAVALMILALLILNLQPFRSGYSMINATFIIILAMVFTMAVGSHVVVNEDHPLYHPFLCCYDDYWHVSSIIHSLHDILLVVLKETVLL